MYDKTKKRDNSTESPRLFPFLIVFQVGLIWDPLDGFCCNSVVTVRFQSISTSFFYANTLKPLLVLIKSGAEEKTRTSTRLPSHEPESCASTNSATSAL